MNKSEEKINFCKKMFNSFHRGNEIEFAYNSKKYFLLPYWHKNMVIGVLFGEQAIEKETICLSWNELYDLDVQESKFGDIINLIDILWTNFEIQTNGSSYTYTIVKFSMLEPRVLSGLLWR